MIRLIQIICFVIANALSSLLNAIGKNSSDRPRRFANLRFETSIFGSRWDVDNEIVCTVSTARG
jgi:hypothetical protein